MLNDKKKKAYQIILEIKIKEKIEELADSEDRSTSWFINNILKQYLKDKNIPLDDIEDT